MGIEVKSERSVNSVLADDLRVYARRRWPLENDKYRKGRLASLLNMSARRVKSLYEGEQSAVIRQHEAEAVRRLLGQKSIEEANRNDFQALQARIARLEAALLQSDEEFHHEQMAGLRSAVGGGRGNHVAGPARRRFILIDGEDAEDASE